MPINGPLPGNATSAINRQLPQNFSVPGLQQQGLYGQNPYSSQGVSTQTPGSQISQVASSNTNDINPTPGGPLSVPPPPYAWPHTGGQGYGYGGYGGYGAGFSPGYGGGYGPSAQWPGQGQGQSQFPGQGQSQFPGQGDGSLPTPPEFRWR